MNNDFKKASYLLTILLFLLGIVALVGVSAAKYFEFDEIVVTISQIVSLASFFLLFINSIYAKSKYNSACIRFADYILTNKRKETERRNADAERVREIQNIRAAAEHDRDKVIEAARQQGRSEGAQAAGGMSAVRQPMPTQPVMPIAQPFPMPQQSVPAPMPQRMPVQQGVPAPLSQGMPVQQPVPAPMPQRVAEPQRNLPPAGQPNEEVLYNEFGEPVMMRRRVRKSPSSPDGEMLYDSNGNPVIRRNQGLWEPLEQRHEIVFKFETSPGVSISAQESRPQDRREDDQ